MGLPSRVLSLAAPKGAPLRLAIGEVSEQGQRRERQEPEASHPQMRGRRGAFMAKFRCSRCGDVIAEEWPTMFCGLARKARRNARIVAQGANHG